MVAAYLGERAESAMLGSISRVGVLAVVLSMLSAGVLWAGTNFYVSPGQGGGANGTAAKPWPSVQAAFGSGKVRGGDTLLLSDGDYGALILDQARFSSPVIIQSLNGKNAHFERIKISGGSKHLVLKNLSVWPSQPKTGSGTLVHALPATSHITIDALDVGSGRDAAKFLSWSLAEWRSRDYNGIHVMGAQSIVRNSTVTGIRNGIIAAGADSLVERNSVNGFSRDGLRGLGNRGVFRANRVTNCIKIGKNHDDGFQSWSPRKVKGAVISGLKIEGNIIIEWTASPGHPLRCRLQGISMFDGFYDSLIIRNNIVSISAYHGITVSGGRNVLIANNTVVSNSGKRQKNPWIAVLSHKNKSPAQNVTVANNLAMQFKGADGRGKNIKFIDNSVIQDPRGAFEDIAKFNYRPVPRSGFVDSANMTYAPPIDILGGARPFGKGPDRGAFEVGASR